MKFLVSNYSCIQNPWLGDYRPQIPVLSVLNWICWTPSNKIPGYATGYMIQCQCPILWISRSSLELGRLEISAYICNLLAFKLTSLYVDDKNAFLTVGLALPLFPNFNSDFYFLLLASQLCLGWHAVT